MILRDGLYERLRNMLMDCLAESNAIYGEAAAFCHRDPDGIVLAALEDDIECWERIIMELDAAAPENLKRELGIC